MRTCRSPIGLFLTKGRTHPIVGRHPAEESIVRSFRVLSQKSFEGSLKHRAIEPKLELKISFISQLLSSRGIHFWQKFASKHFFSIWSISHNQMHSACKISNQDNEKWCKKTRATILIKVRINFHQIPCYFDPLWTLDTVRAIFEIQEFILYTLWYSDEICRWSKLM